MPSISELRVICQSGIKGKDIWSWFQIQRRFSIYFTKLFVTFGVSANQVTLINLLTVLSALALIALKHFIFGFLLLQLYFVIDCSDGEVARYFKQAGPKGLFIDRLVHIVTEPLLFLTLAYSIDQLWLGIIPALCCENGLRLIGWGYTVSQKEEGTSSTKDVVKKSLVTEALRFFAIYGFTWLTLLYLLGAVWLSLLLIVWSVWTLLACVYLTVKVLYLS